MDANTIDLTKLFTQSVQYVVPIFQRPYVWNEDDHWDPLWQDIEVVMADRAAGFEHPHFLGAVVLDQMPTSTANVDCRQIIDGQQRLTTLQLLLAAARDEASGRQLDRLRGQLALMVENNEYVVESDRDIPKVLPTRSDQTAFLAAMNGDDHDRPSQLVDCYRFFRATISDWLDSNGDDRTDERFHELATTLTKLLRVVVIDLDDQDDAQVIFETLNARGTPLEAADLIKNYLFDRARRAGQDVEALHDDVWSVFLDDYWREDVRQGRLMRSRIDVFINHYLTMQTGREVMSSKLFAAFKQWFELRAESPGAVMEDLERYGTVFSRFDSFPSDTRESVFFRRLGTLDVTTVHPFLLWLFGLDKSQLSVEDRHRILELLESFLVRRMLCRMTTKGYNRHFLSLLLSVREADDIAAGVSEFLLASDADTFRWPNDRELTDRLIESALYGNVRRDRLQLVLAAVSEDAMSDRLEEPIRIAGDLTIEHLMPRRWETHWPLLGGLEERERRDALINTIGNLTIITQGLNSKVSNGPWSDKRQTILQHSALPINRQLPERWDDEAILDRSGVIAAAVNGIWHWPGAAPPDPSESTGSGSGSTTEPGPSAQGGPSVIEGAVEFDDEYSPVTDFDDGTCQHHVLARVCTVCEDDTDIVWTTASGSVFHVVSGCESLQAGRKRAADAGYEAYKIREVSRIEAVSSGRKPCGICADANVGLKNPPRSTARREILSAMDRLEQETGLAACQLSDIVSEVLKQTTRYPETTLRTHIASFMCVDAPHHNPSWPDLRRVDRGVYERIDRDAPEPHQSPDEETRQISTPSDGLPTPLHRLLTRLAGGPPVHSLERGNPNWVIEFDAENVMVETERSRRGGADPQPIPVAWLAESYQTLRSNGSLARDDLSDEASHRSAFILATLAELPGIEVHTRPIRLLLDEMAVVSDDQV